jgi:hypothetical protein
VQHVAEVGEVLGQQRAVVARGVDALGQLAGRRPPSAAVIGSPVERMRKKTVVTRMKIVGKISRKRTSR